LTIVPHRWKPQPSTSPSPPGRITIRVAFPFKCTATITGSDHDHLDDHVHDVDCGQGGSAGQIGGGVLWIHLTPPCGAPASGSSSESGVAWAGRPRWRWRDAHRERQRAAERAGWVPSEVASTGGNSRAGRVECWVWRQFSRRWSAVPRASGPRPAVAQPACPRSPQPSRHAHVVVRVLCPTGAYASGSNENPSRGSRAGPMFAFRRGTTHRGCAE
jgi:hypothetical protein